MTKLQVAAPLATGRFSTTNDIAHASSELFDRTSWKQKLL
jgi:hypothetical protein